MLRCQIVVILQRRSRIVAGFFEKFSANHPISSQLSVRKMHMHRLAFLQDPSEKSDTPTLSKSHCPVLSLSPSYVFCLPLNQTNHENQHIHHLDSCRHHQLHQAILRSLQAPALSASRAPALAADRRTRRHFTRCHQPRPLARNPHQQRPTGTSTIPDPARGHRRRLPGRPPPSRGSPTSPTVLPPTPPAAFSTECCSRPRTADSWLPPTADAWRVARRRCRVRSSSCPTTPATSWRIRIS